MNETLPPPPAPTTPPADKAKITGKQKTIIAVAALLALGLYGTFANDSEAAVADEPATLTASEAVEEPKPKPEPEPEPEVEPVSATKSEPTPEPEPKPEPEPEPTAEIVVEEPAVSQDDVEMIYLSLLRSKVGTADVLSDDEAVGMGRGFCAILDSDVGLGELLIYMAYEYDSMDPADIGVIAGLSIGAFCPEHEWQIDAFAG